MSVGILSLTGETYAARRVTRTEPYEPGTPTPLGTVEGHISDIRGDSTRSGASSDRETLDGTLLCDTSVPLDVDCEITDGDGRVWQVRSARTVRGLGLDHQRCKVRAVQGLA